MGWVQARFAQVEFPLPFAIPGVGPTVGYLFTFFPIYVLGYMLFAKIKNKFPYFSAFESWRKEIDTDTEEMMSFADLATPSAPGKPTP